ncbi:hypothetical protein J8I87_43310 [Paraburkholderia sp. LEh10]|nr:hypothetical protein [Paraburkholderia sp. LEh10]
MKACKLGNQIAPLSAIEIPRNGPWGDVHQVIHRANHGRAEIAPNRKVFDDIQYARNIDFPRRLLPRFVRLTKGSSKSPNIAGIPMTASNS